MLFADCSKKIVVRYRFSGRLRYNDHKLVFTRKSLVNRAVYRLGGFAK